MTTKEEALKELVTPVVCALDCIFWGLQYKPSRRNTILRLYIDKDPITVEDCEKVSRQVASLLDVEDIIADGYTLEVSSPGMDRPLFTLDQYNQFRGSEISLRLRLPFAGRRNFKGLLDGVEGEKILLMSEGQEFIFSIQNIEKANIIPNFEGSYEAKK
ncbi:MAG: ribosome maturation factor RimP [Porticoccus sp.]|jgi:ribosome maturation factor RimP|nr:ribosome maturation factor RimP [Porticoccus sp.]|tara:strand:- start:1331 stop:1807 length:477 start_codon:yes stop_codon:yes gene_type:complete